LCTNSGWRALPCACFVGLASFGGATGFGGMAGYYAQITAF